MAPMIVYMLSVFSDGAAIIRRRADVINNQIALLLMTQMKSPTGDQFNHTIVDKSNKELKANERSTKKRINLLNPKRQIVRIFSLLLAALLCIMFQKLIKDGRFHLYNHTASVILVCLSGFFFIAGLIVLQQIAWAIIDTKQMIGQEKSAVSIGSQESD